MQGLGAFATRPIPAGTRLIEYAGERLTPAEADGTIVLVAELPAPPERVFRALTSTEIVDWWVRPGVFDTREWSGDVREGGRWRSAGVGRGDAYSLEGEFVAVDAPRRLAHTWRRGDADGPTTTVMYLLEPTGSSASGTRLTLRHAGFGPGSQNTALAWETSLERLTEILSSPAAA
jgi:uncharacterized protein YndB with AHSA1/START domain